MSIMPHLGAFQSKNGANVSFHTFSFRSARLQIPGLVLEKRMDNQGYVAESYGFVRASVCNGYGARAVCELCGSWGPHRGAIDFSGARKSSGARPEKQLRAFGGL
jgi:hypothetical protein